MLTRKLQILKKNGFNPKKILDIGAYHGFWTLEVRNIFPNAEFFLIDGIDYKELQRFKNINNINYIIEVLADEEKEVLWYEMSNTGDSFYKERTYHFKKCIPIKKKTKTLDQIFTRKNGN